MATLNLDRPIAMLRQARMPLAILLLSLSGLAWWWHGLRSDAEAFAGEPRQVGVSRQHVA
jgi:hypothetical protein